MRNKLGFLSSVALTALLVTPAFGQNAPVPVSEQQGSSDDTVEEVVVTGSARPQRRFDTSYAVNALSAETIQKLAPVSYSDLLGSVPGIQVESTGGEVQNVTRVRGFPGDRFGLVVQQDGLPLYPQTDGFFWNATDGLNRFDLMTERVEIVRGGPAPVYASNATAIANNITLTGGPNAAGAAQVTLGDTGLYRLDAVQSGPVAEDTYYAVGGFIRYHEGYRDNGFPNDVGGQFRASLRRDLDNGYVKVFARYLNDRNMFYLPIPIADPRNPSVSLDPFIDFFTGTMNTPALRNVNIRYFDQGALKTLKRDLADGRHIEFANVGFEFERDFAQTTFNFKSSLTSGSSSFDALYSTTNPVDGNVFAAGQLAAARTAFGASVARLEYRIAGTGSPTVYNPAADSGLVMQAQYRGTNSEFYSFINELSATRTFETGLGSHDVKLGLNAAFWGVTSFGAFQNYLIQVKSQPQILDLVALSGTGAVLGSVTNGGVLSATTSLFDGENDARSFAVYLNDTWSITDRLILDAGFRHEEYDYTGFVAQTSRQALPGTTIADTFALGFTSAQSPVDTQPSVTNWTVGANYDFTGAIGAYARFASLESPPQSGQFLSFPLGTVITTAAEQYELGLKLRSSLGYLYLTGFETRFDPLNASFSAFNPLTGAFTNVPFVGTANTRGVEMDGVLRLGDNFRLAGAVTVSSPEYRDFVSVTGADAAAILGKQIVREPKIYGHITPTFAFDFGDDTNVEIYADYEYTGERFVDVLNTTALPAFSSWGAGVVLTSGPWRVQLVGDNLTNEEGLTEGNTRTDNLSGQGTREAVYGRPIFGRNVRLIVGLKW